MSEEKNNTFNQLSSEEEKVIVHKGTEKPFSGKYLENWETGTYACKRCGAPLYKSADKFNSQCGWPSFDNEIPGAVKRIPDPDGIRTEIVCNNCDGHLGHVFIGEGLTEKNIRHCVNSISLDFMPADENIQTQTAYYAGGCFWGMEYFFRNEKGVISTQVGYMGGHTENPSYSDVCDGTTGHAEIIKVDYDPSKTTYEKLTKLFFEIHDPTQINRQGPDIGEQYRSVIFYVDDEQQKTGERLIKILTEKGYEIATELTQATTFWKAEEYHQDYYQNNGKQPYCHSYMKKF